MSVAPVERSRIKPGVHRSDSGEALQRRSAPPPASCASSRAGSRSPASAARATPWRRSMRCGSSAGKRLDAEQLPRGAGKPRDRPSGSVKTWPCAAERRLRTAVAWARCRRWLRIDHAAASYGEWKSTGPEPGMLRLEAADHRVAGADLRPRRPGLVEREHPAHLGLDQRWIRLAEELGVQRRPATPG